MLNKENKKNYLSRIIIENKKLFFLSWFSFKETLDSVSSTTYNCISNLELSSYFLFLLGFLVIVAMGVIFSINPIASLMSLVLTYVLSSMLLIMFNLEFIGLLLTIVYVGAVAVLFLFIIMMLKFERISEYKKKNIFLLRKKVFFFTFISFISAFFFNLLPYKLFSFLSSSDNSVYNTKFGFTEQYISEKVIFTQSSNLLSEFNSKDFVLLNKSSWKDFNILNFVDKGNFEIDLKVIGGIFYTEYGYIFILCGIILLTCIIAPILLTFKDTSKVKKQYSSYQVNKSKVKSIKLKDL